MMVVMQLFSIFTLVYLLHIRLMNSTNWGCLPWRAWSFASFQPVGLDRARNSAPSESKSVLELFHHCNVAEDYREM